MKIADDFTPPSDGPPDGTGQGTARRIDDKEACLAYVAVSRARRRLDIGGLSWISEHPQGVSAGPELPQGFTERVVGVDVFVGEECTGQWWYGPR